jgi:hypothetical protein
MSNINRIDVRLITSTKTNAGTDGRVYIGVAGREFYINSSGDDFEKGADHTYVLGKGSNIKYDSGNDPQKPQLVTGDLNKYPVYLRFEPLGENPDWNLEYVIVTVNPGENQIRFENKRLSGSPDIWLGQKKGKYVYLSHS